MSAIIYALLTAHALSVTEIGWRLGFSATSSFTTAFGNWPALPYWTWKL
jgi:AraC-like DNA-binding protein